MARTIAKDHDAKRQAILKTAARVFAREGIARSSMNSVARACGISKANIYHYYDSKDTLLFDILDSYLSALRDATCTLAEDGSPAEQLHALTKEILLAYDGMDNEHRIQIEGLALLPAAQQKVLRDYQREMVAQMSDRLQAVAPERFAGDPRLLRDTTMSVFGMLNWFFMWNSKASRADRARYAAHVADLVIGGMANLPKTDPAA